MFVFIANKKHQKSDHICTGLNLFQELNPPPPSPRQKLHKDNPFFICNILRNKVCELTCLSTLTPSSSNALSPNRACGHVKFFWLATLRQHQKRGDGRGWGWGGGDHNPSAEKASKATILAGGRVHLAQSTIVMTMPTCAQVKAIKVAIK